MHVVCSHLLHSPPVQLTSFFLLTDLKWEGSGINIVGKEKSWVVLHEGQRRDGGGLSPSEGAGS